MIIVSLELTLDFAKETQINTPAKAVFEALGGKLSAEQEPHEPRAIIRSEKNKFALNWDYKSCSIIQEDISNVQQCIGRFVKALEKINGVAPIGRISCKKLRVFWILPVDGYDFKRLEMKYRKTFIKDSELFSNCFDSTIVIDMKYDQWELSHQSGAMDVNQLQNQFREFNIKEGHPEIFLFLSTIVSDKQLGEYSRKDIASFLNKSYEICNTHSDNFGNLMEGIL